MTDDLTPALEAGEVVQSEAIEAEAPEAAESTEGQDQSQPAEDESEGQPEGETEDQKSKSQERRERRKAEQERNRQALADAEKQAREAQERIKAYEDAAKNLKAPKQSDFQDFETYQAALSAHYMMRGFDSREAARLQAEAKAQFDRVEAAKQAQAQEAAQNWAAQTAEARQKYPDFDAVTGRPDLPFIPALAAQIKESDVAGEVAYFLGRNPEMLAQIASKSPVEMARAIGRIEQQVSAPQPKTVSTAPAPINPVRPKASASKDPGDMSPAEYRKWKQSGGTF